MDGPFAFRNRLTRRGKLFFSIGLVINGLVVPLAVIAAPEHLKLPVGFALSVLVPLLVDPLVATAKGAIQASVNREANKDPSASGHVLHRYTDVLATTFRKDQGSLDGNEREARGLLNGADVLVTQKLNHAEWLWHEGHRGRSVEDVAEALLTVFRYPVLLPDVGRNRETLPQAEMFPGWRKKLGFCDDAFRRDVRQEVLEDTRFGGSVAVLDQLLDQLMPRCAGAPPVKRAL